MENEHWWEVVDEDVEKRKGPWVSGGPGLTFGGEGDMGVTVYEGSRWFHWTVVRCLGCSAEIKFDGVPIPHACPECGHRCQCGDH